MDTDNDLPTPQDIIDVHDRLEDQYDLKHKGTMKAAPKAKLRREVIEPAQERENPYQRAAVLLFKIQSVHVFQDANKRTAWAVTVRYLERKEIKPEFTQSDETIEKIVRRAGLLYPEALTEWFKTGEIDESQIPES
jgi:death-on-curing family protein